MFLDAFLVGANGEIVRGGVEADWVMAVFDDPNALHRPTRLFVEDSNQVSKVEGMTLTDVWVNLLAFHPAFLKNIPRCEGGDDVPKLWQ